MLDTKARNVFATLALVSYIELLLKLSIIKRKKVLHISQKR